MKFSELRMRMEDTVISACADLVERTVSSGLDAAEAVRDFIFGRPIEQSTVGLAGILANSPALRACCSPSHFGIDGRTVVLAQIPKNLKF